MNDEDFLALQKGIAAANAQDITFKQIASKKNKDIISNDLASQKTSKLKREWVSLTDDEKQTAVWTDGSFGSGALWAEAKLKEKNT